MYRYHELMYGTYQRCLLMYGTVPTYHLPVHFQEIVRGMGWTMIGMMVSLVVILLLQYVFRRQWTVDEDLGPILTESIVEESDNENVFQD